MSDHILCVRIAQRVLATEDVTQYSRFPFDRVYLGKKHLTPQFDSLFRYYLSLPLDRPLLAALCNLHVTRVRETRVKRDTASHIGISKPASGIPGTFNEWIKDPEEWLMVVPTHVRAVYGKAQGKEPYKSELAYFLTRAIDGNHNRKVQLPNITLTTPTRKIPLLCAMCKNVLELYAGKCVLGQPACARYAKIRVAYDDHNKKSPGTGES